MLQASGSMALSLTTRTAAPDITVIELDGPLTLSKESSQIESLVLKALNGGSRKLVIDLTHVGYIDSTGIGIIAYCFAKIGQLGAKAAVSGAKGLVLDVFKITHLDTVIEFFPDVNAACAQLNAPEAAASK
jgi:anti-sigma B factor antagonist